ncbi:MAG: TIM barrel protein [Hadesarchaea archaeon]|nr:TIM barrel protein [Hadesarchaea archaeon]
MLMSRKIRIGPAGNPKEYKGASVGAPEYIREEGLNAYEYQGTRGIRISEESARELKENAEEHDIWVTIHGQYWINFASVEEETIEKSKNRLFKAARIGALMGAHQVVFHPAYYSDRSPEEALELAIEGISEVAERLKSEDIDILLGPETSGKKSQLGSLDEIIQICQEVSMTEPTVDFAHIHAREGGIIESEEDYLNIFEKIENALGNKIANNLHTHFTELEFTEKGEKKHLTYGTEYSPPFKPLAKVIVENGYTPVIISESPILDKDALKFKRELENEGYEF